MKQIENQLQELINEHKRADNNSAALYVTSYGRYNEYGGLSGMWVDMSTFYGIDDFKDFCAAYLGEKADPMFCDYENLPGNLYSESWDEGRLELLFGWLDLDDDDRETVGEYWKYVDSDSTDFQEMLDALIYKGDDFNEYYDELADDMIRDSNAPECVARYFNYAAWEHDCSLDYYEGDRCLFSRF